MNNNNHITFLFLLCIFFLFLYFFIKSKCYGIYPYVDGKEIVSLEYFLQNARTGDLLFLSGKTHGENIIKWYTECPFSHIGLLISTDNQIYIWESDIGQQSKDGCRIINLENKLEKWKGYKIAAWKRLISDTSEEIDEKDLLTTINKHIDKTIDSSCLSYFFNTCKKEKEVFCSELIALSLQDLNIISGKRNACTFSPETFLNNKISYNNGFSYSNTKYFYF